MMEPETLDKQASQGLVEHISTPQNNKENKMKIGVSPFDSDHFIEIGVDHDQNERRLRSCLITYHALTHLLFRTQRGTIAFVSEPEDVEIVLIESHLYLSEQLVLLLYSESYEPYEGDIVPCISPTYYRVDLDTLIDCYKSNNTFTRLS